MPGFVAELTVICPHRNDILLTEALGGPIIET
jgi:hypothetical protein